MRYVSWLLRTLLFFLLLGFAVKNSEIVTLHYYLGYQWQAPLVLIILMFFTFGAAVGVMATLGFIFKQRRKIAALKKELRLKQNSSDLEAKAID